MTRFLLDTNAAADCIFRRKGVDDRVRQIRLAGQIFWIAARNWFSRVEFNGTAW
jgi:hypothetical protein